MSTPGRKIVAIGGGENGRIHSSGEREPYELYEIDREIVRLTGREKPRFLMLAHAQIGFDRENERRYFDTMRRIYGDRFGCECRWLKISDLRAQPEKAREYAAWADIIYEGGGNTVAMIGLWRETGFDSVLKGAWEAGKVMCGVSAGAICWFASGNTDTPGYEDRAVNETPGLGFVDAYLSPHCEAGWKRASEIRSLRHIPRVGLSVSGCSAIEIVDDGYRVLKSTPADSAFRPYVLRTFWRDGTLFEEELAKSAEFRPLERLLAMEK